MAAAQGADDEFDRCVSEFGDACTSIIDAHQDWTRQGRPPVLCDWFLFQRLSVAVETVRTLTVSVARALLNTPCDDPDDFTDLLIQLVDLGFITLAIADDMEFLPPMAPIVSEMLADERRAGSSEGCRTPRHADRSIAYTQGRPDADSITASDLIKTAVALTGVVALFTNAAPLPVSIGMILMGPDTDR